MKCEWCILRPREEGGNGSCRAFKPHLVHIRKSNRGLPVEVREPVETAWPKHLQMYPTGCASFVAGDLAAKEKHVEATETMF